MRKLITTIIIISSLTTKGQVGINENSITIQDLGICIKLSYTTDILGDKYLSGTLKYDAYGREVLNQNFNKSRDIIARETSEFSGDSMELIIYQEGDIVDTAIHIYDNLGREHYEYWYWGDENDSEETYYHYKGSTDTLICIHDIYSWGQYHDSLFYFNNLLKEKASYDLEYGIESEEKYVYKDTLLVEKTEYDYVNALLDIKETYLYNDNSLLDKLIIKYYATDRKVEKNYSYYDNGMINKEIITQYEGSNFSQSSIHSYDSNGLQIRSIFKNSSGKLTEIDYIYLKHDECSAANNR